jgi:hypothetical protein
LPGWVLHQDNAGAILADDVASVAESESEKGTEEHEDDEADVCSITDGLVFLDVDVFTEGDLSS